MGQPLIGKTSSLLPGCLLYYFTSESIVNASSTMLVVR